MKKSGNWLSFALFGLSVQSVYLFLMNQLFLVDLNQFVVLTSILVSWCFVALRYLMDWKEHENKLEDFLRETYISSTVTSRLAFSLIGTGILVLANTSVPFLGYKSLVAGMFAVMFSQTTFEFLRIQFNELKEESKDLAFSHKYFIKTSKGGERKWIGQK